MRKMILNYMERPQGEVLGRRLFGEVMGKRLFGCELQPLHG